MQSNAWRMKNLDMYLLDENFGGGLTIVEFEFVTNYRMCTYMYMYMVMYETDC